MSTIINKSKDILDEIEKAVKSGKYFVMITRQEGDKLYHKTVTEKFPKPDITASIESHINALKGQRIIPNTWDSKTNTEKK